MRFVADLHIHSKFSRATSKTLDLESIYVAARQKGIGVVATGDFTHPAWFAEIRHKLDSAEPGLFRLANELQRACEEQVPSGIQGEVRFILVSEISNIYKKDGKVRKNHNLVFMPDLESCAAFNQRLQKIGNIESDGRPILGLDARNLLEIVLETSEDAFLIPAHIWTPWFSVLGSKSGFDSLQACFEDLTENIFAVETGLSSDPAMNWQVGRLDGMTLVSNSDAHSADKLGREANWFDTDLSYFGIRRALEFPENKKFLGTFEFYAQEGKYHFDGHRKCGVRLSPEESRPLDGKCPVCGKPLTLGVLNRVMQLADRAPGVKPPSARPYFSILPLREVLSQILCVGPASKKVARYYRRALEKFGSEFNILHQSEPQRLESPEIPLLAKAIEKMRQGRVRIFPGFDGEFGRLQLFDDQEREQLLGQASLFAVPPGFGRTVRNRTALLPAKIGDMAPKRRKPASPEPQKKRLSGITEDLNAAQRRAVLCADAPLLIVAGPGTGKTRTLTHKAAYLVGARKICSRQILALTFTKRAAAEMQNRLQRLVGTCRKPVLVTTFHGLCRQLLADSGRSLIDALAQRHWVREALAMIGGAEKVSLRDLETVLSFIASAKQRLKAPAQLSQKKGRREEAAWLLEAYAAYQHLLDIQHLLDYEDLIFQVVRKLEREETFREALQQRFRYVLVDEYQDINFAQYRLIRLLADGAEQVCAIGDPNQSIYGFRGSDPQYFLNFMQDYPNARVVVLSKNYRSTRSILRASAQVIGGHVLVLNPASGTGQRIHVKSVDSDIQGFPLVDVIETPSPRAEAVAVGRIIEDMVGGLSLLSVDSGRVSRHSGAANRSFSDFAVLYRTADDGRLFSEIFGRAGIPHQVSSRQQRLDRGGVRELLDLLKLVEQEGSLLDFEKIAGLHVTGRKISKRAWRCFKTWCFERQLDLQDAMEQMRRFPISGMHAAQQRELNAFAAAIDNLRVQVQDLTVASKLEYLSRYGDFPQITNCFEMDQEAHQALKSLLAEAAQAGFKADAFLADINLRVDADLLEAGVEKVALMTMHAAKGLEFPVVFVAGCSHENIPYLREKGETDMDEERRLLYVAMTRTKERLFLTLSKRRRLYGKWQDCSLSPFVAGIDKKLLKFSKSAVRRPVSRAGVQLKLF